MKKQNNACPTSPGDSPQKPERGSALLIVLGFLSFMMISAVSFAIFMRIERQASSNYRHAVTARHMLNAGLARAIDEVDRHLGNTKFPSWPGRVYPGGTNTASGTVQDTRVLSLESLSFLPGIFVNDVRYHALTGDTRPVWRQLSMPINFNSGENAFGGAEVGRYAFVCVNLSDMLNVNAVSAAQSGTNRISIGHLFRNDAAAETFDDNKQDRDKRYETLQDFYACMFENNDPTFTSPFHRLLDTGDDTSFDSAGHHVLVTDGIVKPEPGNANAFAITEDKQPVTSGLLGQTRAQTAGLNGDFKTALTAAVGGLNGHEDLMALMIADYLDKDSIPKRLDIPTVEMVPMVSQILLPNNFAPVVVKVPEPSAADPSKTKDIYKLQLFQTPRPVIDVEVVWPFKHQKERTAKPAFRVEVLAYVKVIKNHQDLNSATITPELMNNAFPYKLLVGEESVDSFWNDDTGQPPACYKTVHVRLGDAPPASVTYPIIDSESGVIQTPAAFPDVNNPFSVAVAVYVRVKQGAEYVDSAPQNLPALPPAGSVSPTELQRMPKLFFQTAPRLVQPSMQIEPMPYEWRCLETPDPRFNHKVDAWVRNAGEEGDSITAGINPSTTALLGEEGRDGDFYLTTSDIGEMRSPGELGLILRPPHASYSSASIGSGVDFRARTVTDIPGPDRSSMFRTIRLYDHGGTGANQGRDRIYEHFTEGDPDAAAAEVRVNPLSDLPPVLVAAIQNTPVDWFCAKEKQEGRETLVFNDTDVMSAAAWRAFTNGWFQCMREVRSDTAISTARDQHLSTYYGDMNHFNWYAGQDPGTIFGQTLPEPLHEVDRKMLFSWSIGNFSDRQQLFLYVLRAEATVPSFGGSDMGGVKSVAGGRAVALVWRDPYPAGYPDSTVSDPANFREHRVLFFKQLDN